MDSLTHIVIGAAVGQATLGKRLGRKALFWGALAATIPDFDVVVGPFVDPTREIFIHRGFSHSIVFAMLAAPLVGWLAMRVHSKYRIPHYQWFGLVLLCLLSHITLDVFNTYGTGVLYPISQHRFAFDSMAIVDIFLVLPLIAALAFLIAKWSSHRLRQWVAWGAIGFTALYLGYSAINKLSVEQEVERQLAQQGIDYQRVRTSPLPLTNLLWLTLAEDSTGYHMGYMATTDNESIRFTHIPRNNHLLDTLINHRNVRELIRFSEGYYTITTDSLGSLWFHDLRFGSMAFHQEEGWYVFSFNLNTNEGGVRVSRASPNRRFSWENALIYFRRIGWS